MNTHRPVVIPGARSLLLLLLLLPLSSVWSQRSAVFRLLNHRNGLSNDQIHHITQDRNGLIWIGSEKGANVYDGQRIIPLQIAHDSAQFLSQQFIRSILEGPNGNIWLAPNRALLFCYNPATEALKQYRLPIHQKNNFTPIRDLYFDGAGILWIAHRKGFSRFNPATEEFTVFDQKTRQGQLLPKNIEFIHPVPNDPNLLYINGSEGIWTLNKEKETITPVKILNEYIKSRGYRGINNIALTTSGSLLVGAEPARVLHYSPSTGDIQDFPVLPPNSNFKILDILTAPNSSQVYVTMEEKGLATLNIENGEVRFFQHEPTNPTSIWPGTAKSLFLDRDQQLWVGMERGIALLAPDNQLFHHIYFPKNKGVSSQNPLYLSGVVQIPGDPYWYVGSVNGEGLYQIDPRSEKIIASYQQLSAGSSNPSLQIRDLKVVDDKTIWMVTDRGILIFDPLTKRFSRPDLDSTDPNLSKDLLESSLFANLEVWENQFIYASRFGQPRGLLQINLDKKEFTFFPSTAAEDDACGFSRQSQIRAIAIAKDGKVWMGGRPNVQFFDPDTECFTTVYRPEEKDSLSLLYGSKTLTSVRKGGVMVAQAPKGLFWYQQQGEKVAISLRSNPANLPVYFFRGFKQDHQGDFWAATNQGIVRISENTDKYQVFTMEEGLQWENFDYARNFQFVFFQSRISPLASGHVCFGGPGILTYLHTDEIPWDQAPPVSKFRFLDIHQADSTRTISIAGKEKIRLGYNDNFLTIRFSALEYAQPESTVFQYQLQGLENYPKTAEQAEVNYTKLEPGRYTFLLKAGTRSGSWETDWQRLEIQILPPWWATWWAKAFYVCCVLSLLYLWYRSQLYRQKERLEKQRLVELDQFKNRLYTNITHEFRTPLTIIQGESERLQQISEQPSTKQSLRNIRRNGLQLLTLINQMLDLSRLDSQQIPIAWTQDNLIGFLKYLLASYHSYAKSKQIRLHFLPHWPSLEMDFDPEKIQYIVGNLVSNAIKYTQAEGDVYLQTESVSHRGTTHLKISVKDNGPGIPQEDLPHIFNRYYRVSEGRVGSGIGLNISKEYVELLGGTISVESQIGIGTLFNVLLPITRNAPMKSVIPELDSEDANLSALGSLRAFPADQLLEGSEKPIVLIAEDNPEIAHFLKETLENTYQLAFASNGKIGVEKAKERIPDLIVSDVMMPEWDGFELVKQLKQATPTSHIPIILLTAKSDQSSRLTGLETGAQAYLAKPFQIQELQLLIRNLIALRDEQQVSMREAKLNPAANNPEITFLNQLKQLLDDNLSDDAYGIPEVCRGLGISRVHLHRKLKALTGESTSQYIRNYRLRKAKTLLKTEDLNISEVAYSVGFKDPAYFSRTFSELFGESPSESRALD
ncbi:MAG: ATP-binding protein [Bacteroidota bacterium]